MTQGRKARGPARVAQPPKEGTPIAPKLLVLAIAAGVLLGSTGDVPQAPRPQPRGLAAAVPARTSSSCWDYRTAERLFTQKMNGARRASDAVALRLDPQLSRVARKHTNEMIGADTLYHTPTNMLMRRVTNWAVLGENVGVGGTVDSLHAAFMASPAHRDNILYGAFRHVGVGVKQAGGRMWVTVIFESRKDPGTRLSMPSC